MKTNRGFVKPVLLLITLIIILKVFADIDPSDYIKPEWVKMAWNTIVIAVKAVWQFTYIIGKYISENIIGFFEKGV